MQWIKLVCNLGDNRKIKLIRKSPDGETLVLLWIMILLEAGKCNRGGYLLVSETMPHTAETISMVTDIPLSTVQLGFGLYSQLGMIDWVDEAIYVANWAKYQSEDNLEIRRKKDRDRKRKQREREKAHLQLTNGSRDISCDTSRDVTQESKSRKEPEKNQKKGLSENPQKKHLESDSIEQVWQVLDRKQQQY
jgi:predicted phage replisome organizer